MELAHRLFFTLFALEALAYEAGRLSVAQLLSGCARRSRREHKSELVCLGPCPCYLHVIVRLSVYVQLAWHLSRPARLLTSHFETIETPLARFSCPIRVKSKNAFTHIAHGPVRDVVTCSKLPMGSMGCFDPALAGRSRFFFCWDEHRLGPNRTILVQSCCWAALSWKLLASSVNVRLIRAQQMEFRRGPGAPRYAVRALLSEVVYRPPCNSSHCARATHIPATYQ